MHKLGFIGLGIMGKPMAENLLKAGYSLVVWDIREDILAGFARRGVQIGNSPKSIAEQCDVILTMLPNSPEVKEVALGESGVIKGIGEGKVLIDMSSIAPLVAVEIAVALRGVGADMLDAPVSGGEEKAKAGTLAFMVGGNEEVFNKYKSILEAMGNPTLVGEVGAGQITKLVNQAIVATNIAIIAEALSLGKKAGVSPSRIVDAIRRGLAGSQCLEDKAPRMIGRRYQPGFRIRLHAKDLTNVLQTSRELHVAMPLTATVMEMLQVLLADGHEEVDHAGLALYYEKLNGVSLEEQ